MEELSAGATPGNAQGLVYAGAEKIAHLEAVTPGETLGDTHVLNDLVGDTQRHIGQCAGSGPHAKLHLTRDGGKVTRRHTWRCLGTGRD